ncbi:MAG: thiamine pyrophosphate-binding protein [Succiniclasticum sp.]|uniref:thiamine pyrophosphate-binding protein n=1 Tax=Succiniclasticum sp. TaxID=2775030 RepID=UPI002A91C835|nr:thiamine pyrophosphate-binding protein [Succiniclasticum sp.]MDY6290788.1 thiamine pyrophosphate-binding protein [Succiniclasticum sp.]
MKIRLADYIANFLVAHGVTDSFSVVGGGAMHLNDAFGHHEKLKVTYNHHEQACAIAAEAYARLKNRIAAVCVTTGPGGTNALTGVVGGWLDSIPMFIISGQVRYDTTARFALKETGAVVRAMGDQEYDIVKSVAPMTKYAVMIEDPKQIRYALEKAWHLATTGRPGPVWIDVPVNYQGMTIETEGLEGYDPTEDDAQLPPAVSEEIIKTVLEKIKNAKRPVFHAGYGIRLSGGYAAFRSMLEKLNIPVVTYWNAVDLIEDEHPLYCGRAGNMGDRPGNFAIQNADLILAVGTRISIRQVGYNWKTWAREAEVIMVDIDPGELKKPTLHVEMPIWADAKDFLEKLDHAINEFKNNKDDACSECENKNDKEKKWIAPVFRGNDWLKICQNWKKNYPAVMPRQWEENGKTANVYAFVRYLSSQLPENSLTAVSNGACCVVGNQAYVIQKGSRMANNSAIASMGYGLPAAIGTCIGGGRRETICLEGDGSIMMNLQELQTIITNQLPIKIFLINNNGYHSIRITQTNLFGHHTKVGIGPESGDLSFPEFKKIAEAFGYRYYSAHSNAEMKEVVDTVLNMEGPVFTEIFTDTDQVWEPKSSTKRLEDGTLVSPPLEDLAPFLSREELKRNMFIPLLDEE